MSAPALYVETSALLHVLFREAPYDQIERRIDGAESLLTSRLTRIECARALRRVALGPGATAAGMAGAERDLARLFDRIELLEITAEVADLAERIAPDTPLRSLDAIHLATWQLVRRIDPELELLTTDHRLATAAGIEPTGA